MMQDDREICRCVCHGEADRTNCTAGQRGRVVGRSGCETLLFGGSVHDNEGGSSSVAAFVCVMKRCSCVVWRGLASWVNSIQDCTERLLLERKREKQEDIYIYI